MNVLKKISFVLLAMSVMVSCDKEDVQVNTGPLLVSEIIYEGVDFGSGTVFTATLANDARDVPVEVFFTVTFSKTVDAASITSESIKLFDGDDEIPTTINLVDNVVTITPSSMLENNSSYNLVLSEDIQATDGGKIAEAGNFSGVNRLLNTVGPPPYVPDGQVAYWSFNFDYKEQISGTLATEVGTPGFANASAAGPNALASTTDSYLTFPTTELTNSEFTATFWYKVNASPDRAGILVMGPPDDTPPMNNRDNGFRFFRENANGEQRFKLNVGHGTGDSWFDGGEAADLPADADWAFLAFTISSTECVVYINGEVARQGSFSGVDWTGCDVLSIASGSPRFVEWGHLSDESFIDELRIFDVALPQTEIQKMME
ncbi:LamG-like jellyroll fold domain-containing protein [Fulvivirga sp. M361]|uniref:LamG-like jellyroll fold domain-containing protein n=1 Tax=Fulvivirga sp. M361 TaxID=2594266 RepID=UPI00210374C3|nr:LamG-like jellyroll fold domain-containing protein [Fulvivirga sp. M361]